MIHSRACTALVMRFEACRLHAYPDPATKSAPWTCGWGATGADIKPGTIWSQTRADFRLNADLARTDAAMTALIDKAPTTQGQFDALVSLAYNVGPRALQASTLLRLHREGWYAPAAAEFPKWDKANGVVMPGLVTRRAAEAALYRGAT